MISTLFYLALAPSSAAIVAAPTPEKYVAEIAAWRTAREERLRADGGWLTVAGLTWLEQGRNRFGSDLGNQIVLPRSAPAHAGWITFAGTEATLQVAPGVDATIDEQKVRESLLHADTTGAHEVVVLGSLRFHLIERGGRYGIRVVDLQSSVRANFAGLKWYPVREEFRIDARFVPHENQRTIDIVNVIGQVTQRENPGYAEFEIAGHTVALEALSDGAELFFIFRDETSTRDTYGAGRFLYAAPPANGHVVLDFNRAYSPPCAYTAYATCPLPPRANWLDISIEAGEKDPKLH